MLSQSQSRVTAGISSFIANASFSDTVEDLQTNTEVFSFFRYSSNVAPVVI